MLKKGLGRGLQALIPPIPLVEEDYGNIQWIDIDSIQPNQNQPRKNLDKQKLGELAESIKEHGIVQPIIVRRIDDYKYELVAGERRWRASKIAELDKVPAIIKDYNKQQVSEIALIENIQREDLNPIEEAGAYKTLIEEYGLTQEDLSKKVGKSRPYIANILRLLGLNDEIKSLLIEGRITSGHARALLPLQDEDDKQKEIAYQIIDEKLSVRQVEELVAAYLELKQKPIDVQKKQDAKSREKAGQSSKDDDYLLRDLEEKLQSFLGTRVNLRYKNGKGKIEISFYSDEELNRLLDILQLAQEEDGLNLA
ncbi:MAG: ParB/RepB/Spo0J family partition protein [Bacillota bacterium]